jgi:hypothetical protein
MDGLAAIDPQVTVDVIQEIPSKQTIFRHVIHSFNGEATITVPAPDESPSWRANISFSKYDAVSGFFFQPKGEPSPTFTMRLTRLPSAWKPQFAPLKSLAQSRFQTFKSVVAMSTNVDLKKGPAVGDLNANYDILTDLRTVRKYRRKQLC